jgi:phosphatidylinositol alpha 1,6-mannosyltransferase
MASGLPIVSANAPSARALLDDRVNGYLRPASDLACYLESLETLIGSPDKRAEVGARALRASEAYGWDRESERVEQVYKAIKR